MTGPAGLPAALAAALLAGGLPLAAGPGPAGTPRAGGSAGPALLVVAGVAGGAERRARFTGWAGELCAAARSLSWPVEARVLVERPAEAESESEAAAGGCAPAGRSTRDEIGRHLADLAAGHSRGEPLTVVLIGHGSAGGGQGPRFNLPGPDLAPEDLASMLDAFEGSPVTVAHLGSAAGGFVEGLSAPGRIVLAASRAHETNETRFPRHFVAAFAGGGADRNRDDRLSALEVFEFARGEVEREYEREGLLRTEHPLLDDNGDGEGSAEPRAAPGSDGALAARTYPLSPASGAAARAGAPDSAEARALAAEHDALAARVDALRETREGMPDEDYYAELERLLLDLARIREEIRDLAGRREPGAR